MHWLPGEEIPHPHWCADRTRTVLSKSSAHSQLPAEPEHSLVPQRKIEWHDTIIETFMHDGECMIDFHTMNARNNP